MSYFRDVDQSTGSVVEVGSWVRDFQHGIYPVGAKPKQMVFCPADALEPFLIPGHPYLFKTALGWQSQQIWSELISYRISRLCNIEVPRCFLAHDSLTRRMGVLVEFFYRYPDESPPARFFHGAEYIQRASKQDKRPHGVLTNVEICAAYNVPDPIGWWAKTLTFDALIGNTDRHSENWGLLFRGSEPEQIAGMAPAFDNGTSLGYGLTEQKLEQAWSGEQFRQFVRRGTHDCGWDPDDDARAHHIPLCQRFLAHYPEASATMQSVIRFDGDLVEPILDWCTGFHVDVPFTPVRARFVRDLIHARKEELVAALSLR